MGAGPSGTAGTLLLAIGVLIALTSCSDASEPTTTDVLTEVPDPHPATCDLAAEFLILADGIRVTIEEDNGGSWHTALEGVEDQELADSYIAQARQLSIEASVVGATDPWALYVEGASRATADSLQDVGRGVLRMSDIQVPTGFSNVVRRCP